MRRQWYARAAREFERSRRDVREANHAANRAAGEADPKCTKVEVYKYLIVIGLPLIIWVVVGVISESWALGLFAFIFIFIACNCCLLISEDDDDD